MFTNEAGESLSFMRKAKYIGSFLVTGGAHFERADIVRQKLEAARGYTQSKPILLVISLHGIKVCDDSGTSVHMAHALRRISYATCDPDCCQFAFLAREPKAQPNVQYCHAFVTKTPEEAENLNNLVGEAFRIAYAQQRALLESRRAVAQTQTSSLTTEATAVAATSPHHHLQQPLPPPPPPPVASNPVPEADSGIATTDAASFRRKIDMVGYLAVDSGLSSSESASRGVKPRSLQDAPDNDEADDADEESHVKCGQGVDRLPLRPGLTSSNQSHCCQPLKDIVTPTPDKHGKSHQQLRNLNANPRCRKEPHDSPTHSSVAVVDTVDASDYADDLEAMGIGEEEEEADAGFAQQPPSAPHPTPLPVLSSPHSRNTEEVDEVELASSLAAIPGPVGRRRPTPFSPSASSANAYDQASESLHSPPCPDPRRRRTAIDAASASGSCSSGGGGGADSLKTSAGGIPATHHVAPPISAPWYQPHIPRDLALDMLSRQPPGSFVVRDSGTHSNCYALSVRVGGSEGETVHSHSTAAAERCLSAGMAPRATLVGGAGGGGGISHYLIQRTATGVRLKGLEKEWPSLACLILHLTVMPEMLPCPLLDAPQSSSNPAALLRGGGAPVHPAHFEQAPDACAFRPISARGGELGPLTPSQQAPPPSSHSEYQQLSEFSSLLADLNIPEERRRHRRHPPPPPPARNR
ncbi:SH2 domain-containing protein 5 [Taenia crassiceps]|uniref:SH2 domain-containing protein 5 n=1 Tax=Taenia crassiceps TaxID=6207 RepID=A0ABR4QT94_9CEST